MLRLITLGIIGCLAFAACGQPAAGPAVLSASDLAIGIEQPVNSLNPVTIVTAEETNFAHFVWAGLLGVNASGKLFPMLAQSVPSKSNGLISANGRSITFVLKHNLKWSDGEPITTTDVKFGWQLATKPWADLCRATCPYIQRVIVKSPSRITFRLYQPFSPLLFDLPPVLPRHQMFVRFATRSRTFQPSRNGNWKSTFQYLYQSSTNWLGSRFAVDGPYKVESATNTTVLFERNPEWHILARPAFAHVTLKYFSTDSALLSAVTSDTVDLSQGFAEIDVVNNILNLGALRALHVHLFPVGGVEHLEPNLLGTPLSDTRIRQALSLDIDRSQLIDQALEFPPSVTGALPAYSAEMPGRFDGIAVHGVWDPLKHRFVTRPEPGDANKLLDMAGWQMHPDHLRYRAGCRGSAARCQLNLDLLVPKVYFNRIREATFLAHTWTSQLGVKVTINDGEWAIGNLIAPYSQNGPCARGQFDLCLFAQDPGIDPQTDFNEVFPSNRIARLKQHPRLTDLTNLNFAGVRDATIDHVFATGAKLYNLPRRAALYRKWQVRVAKRAYWIPLFQQPLIVIERDPVRNFHPSPWEAPATPGLTSSAEWNPWELAPAR